MGAEREQRVIEERSFLSFLTNFFVDRRLEVSQEREAGAGLTTGSSTGCIRMSSELWGHSVVLGPL